MKIGVINYGMGNLHSVIRKLKILKVDYVIVDSSDGIKECDKIILPGVGHFGKAMENLKRLQLIGPLSTHAVIDKKPILGICLGMQVMLTDSEEGTTNGLDWIAGKIKKFKVDDKLRFKIPQMGWNSIEIMKDSQLMTGLNNQSEFYFVHSFHIAEIAQKNILNITYYENKFVSAIQKENIYGVQYHPEKSFEAGIQLIRNFIEL